ncbi:MAG: hypothetical protein ACKOI2_07180 [Actinomycetota bacterium]
MDMSEQTSDSLLSALDKARITSENHAFIRRVAEIVGISRFQAVVGAKPYIIATRRDGLRDLNIYWGYTTGFTTEEEATRVGGPGTTIGPSSNPKGTWYVTHPENRVGPREGRARTMRREAAFCDTCGEQTSLTGVCGNCD